MSVTTIPNPETKGYSQTNKGDLLGNVAQTKNIDFDEMGYIKLANRSINIYDETLDASFVRPIAICYSEGDLGRYTILAQSGLTSGVFYAENNLKSVVKDTRGNVPVINVNSDLVSWQQKTYCSGTTFLNRLDGTTWSASLLSAQAGAMCVFVNKNMLALADGNSNTVKLINTSHSVVVTLTIPSEYAITSMAWANSRMYIGTRHQSNGKAALFEWDGATTAVNNSYQVDSMYINSVASYKNSVVLITGSGQLLQFTGSGFQELASFPFFYKLLLWNPTGSSIPGKVIHRGMISDGDLLYINVNSTMAVAGEGNEPTYYNFFPGGIWCYDPDVGLYHRYGYPNSLRTMTSVVPTGSVDTATNIITVAGATVPVSGTPVIYQDGTYPNTEIGGLKSNTKYYVIFQSSTTMKLATTYANALAGTAIDITGTGNAAQYFVFYNKNGFGANRVGTNGAVCLIRIFTGALGTMGKLILFGGGTGLNAITTKGFLAAVVDGIENRGSLIYPKVSSNQVTDIWQKIVNKVRGLATVEDVVVVKYRVAERVDDLKVLYRSAGDTGTWISGNSFSTTRDLSLANVGDEVSIEFAAGAGYLLHISSLTLLAGTWTVVLTESVQNITPADTMRFTIDNWAILGTITSSDTMLFKEFPVALAHKWLQIKIELRGEDVMLEELKVICETQLPAK